MNPFLKLVAEYIHLNYKDSLENLCIVLPNKRGALFLKHHLAQTYGKTIWLPTLISAEEFVSELSELKTLEEIDLVCHLYESYKVCYGADAEPFDSFVKWGQLILQDFNEIDRYLADSEQLYENLKDIKVIENWSLGEENLSEYQINYLKFMNSIGAIYKHYSNFLITNKWAYQGLAYKQAVANIKTSKYPNQFKKLLFCGFNALNASELHIINYLHLQQKADILWDADEYYLNNKNQEAGLFLRNNFNLFKQTEKQFIENNFSQKKDIKIISVPKQIGQAQVVKQTIQSYIDNNVPLDKVAVVLANEKLLWPVLQQLPSGVQYVNITMEYPLRYTAAYSLIEQLLQIHLNFAKQTKKQKTIYHKDLVSLLRQPLFLNYLGSKTQQLNTYKIIEQINARNVSFVTSKNLQQLFEDNYSSIQYLLQPTPTILNLCELILNVLTNLIECFSKQKASNQSSLELEYLQILTKNFNRLNDTILKYSYFNDIKSFKQLFNQVVGNSTAPFIGEPLRGLQIMGVLETRTLDFEYLILVNVNEGVLPSGKSINSFIPNDLKRAFGLPLYLEKDAIYAYHFYRLLQRASEVTITYDSVTDTFGKGEKSRFVTQLQLEMKQYNPNISITEEVAVNSEFPEKTSNVIVIDKNEESLRRILKKATSNDDYSALSPSALITLKECSLKFYFRYGAGLKETVEVEESAEANTFGSILHLSLENLYKEFTGKVIHETDLQQALKNKKITVQQSFVSFFDGAELSGKSLLQEEVINVYVEKLIKSDIKLIADLKKQNQFLTLNKLEQEFSASLIVTLSRNPERSRRENEEEETKQQTIYIKGKIDRIDSYGGFVRILDYKNSVHYTDSFVFTDFEKLFTDKNYNKQFQLLMYAWLLHKNNFCAPEKMQPGIIPFKEFLPEPKYILKDKKTPLILTVQFLNEFESHLITFIESIFNTALPFAQTDDVKTCEYCAYNSICNIS